MKYFIISSSSFVTAVNGVVMVWLTSKSRWFCEKNCGFWFGSFLPNTFSARCVTLEWIVMLWPWCLSVRLSVRLSGMGVYSDHTVHVSADYGWTVLCSGYPDSKHAHVLPSQPSFSSSTWKRDGVWMCKLCKFQERLKLKVKLLLSANRKSYMTCLLAQQRMTSSDL